MSSGLVQLREGRVLKDAGRVSTGEDCCCTESCFQCIVPRLECGAISNPDLRWYACAQYLITLAGTGCPDLDGSHVVDHPLAPPWGRPWSKDLSVCNATRMLFLIGTISSLPQNMVFWRLLVDDWVPDPPPTGSSTFMFWFQRLWNLETDPPVPVPCCESIDAMLPYVLTSTWGWPGVPNNPTCRVRNVPA